MANIHGIYSLEIGDPGADGAAGTTLTPITAIQMDSVTITIPSVEAENIYVEEMDRVYAALPAAEIDPVTINFATLEASNVELQKIFGGTITAGKYTLNRSGVEKTIVLKSRPRNGVQKVFTFPLVLVTPNMDATVTKSDLSAVGGLGTAQTPVDNSGASPVYLDDFYMEDVTVP